MNPDHRSLSTRTRTATSSSKRAKDDRVAHDVGKLRAELELVELESDHYRNSIKRSMALLDAWEDGHAMNNSELDEVAQRKAEAAHNVNSKRTRDKLHQMREMYIEVPNADRPLEPISHGNPYQVSLLTRTCSATRSRSLAVDLTDWNRRLTRFRRLCPEPSDR